MRTGNKISLLISGTVSLIMLALALLLYYTLGQVKVWMIIAAAPVVFIIAYLLIRNAINAFIRRKMNPLHDKLHSLNPDMDARKSGTVKSDIISEVEEEVMDWAEKKTTELEKLKDLETYRKEFLGNVYHELKTPIFNIQGYILTLIEGGLDDAEINKLYLERTERNINRLITIVEDLESISGLESGALDLKMETFNIRKTIREVFEANEMRAKKLNIKLEITKSKEESEKVIADKKWIFRVLNNLVMNSINYGVKNGKTIISLKATGDKIYIEVKDNGIGISRDDLHRIFERFYRVDKSRSRDTGGTGLGLSIVKHILEAHKQTIQVNSVLGKGSSFTFTLDKGS